jgi:hypothetical protein
VAVPRPSHTKAGLEFRYRGGVVQLTGLNRHAPHAPAGVGWPQRACTIPVAVTTAHGVAAHASASRLPCSRLAGGAGAVGAGDAGSCQRCWSIPGPSSPEHTFREDNRSSSVRLKRSAGHEAGCDDYGERELDLVELMLEDAEHRDPEGWRFRQP